MPNPVIEHIHLSGVTYDVKDIGAERLDNKVSTFQNEPDDTHYPSEKLVHDKLSELASDVNQAIDGKQDQLVSGTNIKTINNQSLLGSGNIDISGGGTITVDSELSDTSENPVQNKVIKAALDTKGTYSKPSGGIPASDLASDVIPVIDDALSDISENPVQNKVIKAALDTKGTYSKPSGGIPASDLASDVIPTIDSALSDTSENPVQNKVIKAALDTKGTYSKPETGIPASDLAPDSITAANISDGSITSDKLASDVNQEIDGKQDQLVSGTNIKTINGETLLGSGNIEISGGTVDVDDALSDTSENPVQNKVIKAAIDAKYTKPLDGIPASDLAADINQEIEGKQDQLVSGTNIKTINGETLLGSGNIDISSGGTITVDGELSDASENPVQNKVIKAALDAKYTKPSDGIPASDLAADSITAANISDGSITADKLASGVIPTIDDTLSDDSANPVQNKVIKAELDGKYTKPETGIPASDLAADSITAANISDGSITADKLASGVIPTIDDELSDTSENPVQNKVIKAALDTKGTYSKPETGIPASDLAADVIPTIDSELSDTSTNSVQNKVIKAALDTKGTYSKPETGIPASDLAADSITASNIADGSITADKLASGVIPTIDSALSDTSENPVQNKVIKAALDTKGTYSKPETGIPASDLAADSITASNIADGSITADKLASDVIPTIDSELSDTSTNPVQNKVIKAALDTKGTYTKPSGGIPASDLAADINQAIDGKQDQLVSGTNIKTVNGNSLLGEGDLVISGGGTITIDSELSDTSENPVQNKVITNEINTKQDTLVSGTTIKTVNNETLLGSGNIDITAPDTSWDYLIDYERLHFYNEISLGAVTSVNGKSGDVWLTTSDIGMFVDNEFSDTSRNPVENKVVKAAIDAKYTKPSGGIPASDIASGVIPTIPTIDSSLDASSTRAVQNKVVKAAIDAKYTKPSGGIPASDIASGVIPTIDSALSTSSTNPVQNKVIKAALDTKGTYSKPSGGIPASDLASGVIPTIDSALSTSSTNPVQNKVIKAALDAKGTYTKPSGGIPASDLASGVIPTIDSALSTSSTNPVQNKVIANKINTKQDTLVSGTNIKTINSQSLLGSGNIDISGGGSITVDTSLSTSSTNPVQNKVIANKINTKQDTLVSGTNIKTINSQSLLGSGNITISGGSDRTYTKPWYIDSSGQVVECSTIQAAIDGCPFHGTVHIPWRGTSYSLTSTIHIWKPITLESDYTGLYPYGTLAYSSTTNKGTQPAYSSTTTKILSSSGYGVSLIKSSATDYGIFVHCSGVTLRNISIYCSNLSDSSSLSATNGHAACIVFYSNEVYEGSTSVYFMHHTLVENCAFQAPGGKGDGVYCECFGVARFANVYTFEGRNGFNFDSKRSNNTSVTLESCWAMNYTEIGYYFKTTYYATLISCAADTTKTTTNHGYYFETCKGINAVGCGVEGNNYGVTLYGSQISFSGSIVVTDDISSAVKMWDGKGTSSIFLNNLHVFDYTSTGANYYPVVLTSGSSAVLVNTNITKVTTSTATVTLQNGGMFDNISG